MYVTDKKYFANIFKSISTSVATVNEKIVACREKKISIEALHTSVALEQLSMMHEILIVVATLAADPEINAGPLPELPKKIVGF
jgi:hypothetical protein